MDARDIESVRNFEQKQPVRETKWADLLEASGLPEDARKCLRLAKFYDFTWGTLAEWQQADALMLAIYPAEALRQGISSYFERFLNAYMNVIYDDAKAAEQVGEVIGSPYAILFRDGREDGSAFSIACIEDTEKQIRFRSWVATRLLQTLWPEALQKAMDLSYQFPTQWVLTPGGANDPGAGGE